VSLPPTSPVGDAVILAAGNGDRFKHSTHRSKLLHPVLGRPLILRTLETAALAGVTRFVVVVGFEGDRLRNLVERNAPPGTAVRFVRNDNWHLENGVSALAARFAIEPRRFALLMGDHLFDAAVLGRLLRHPVPDGDSLLAIDRGISDPLTIAEATRVRLDGDRIIAIGKGLDPWDAIDTGLFVFSPRIFDALDEAVAAGETTLSAGVARLAAERSMRGIDTGGATWCDVDTAEDLTTAESLFGAGVAEPA
jgi:choline kinase